MSAECRDCADEDGLCPNLGLPCDPKDLKGFRLGLLHARNVAYIKEQAIGAMGSPNPKNCPRSLGDRVEVDVHFGFLTITSDRQTVCLNRSNFAALVEYAEDVDDAAKNVYSTDIRLADGKKA